MARFDLSEFEWSVIEPLLPNKVGGVARVDDRRVLNGILWRLRTGAPWADIPERYGSHMTCYNCFVRWRKAGVWDRILLAVSEAYDGHQAQVLLNDVPPHAMVLADRAYDADAIGPFIAGQNAWANIPPMPQRRFKPAFSK